MQLGEVPLHHTGERPFDILHDAALELAAVLQKFRAPAGEVLHHRDPATALDPLALHRMHVRVKLRRMDAAHSLRRVRDIELPRRGIRECRRDVLGDRNSGVEGEQDGSCPSEAHGEPAQRIVGLEDRRPELLELNVGKLELPTERLEALHMLDISDRSERVFQQPGILGCFLLIDLD